MHGIFVSLLVELQENSKILVLQVVTLTDPLAVASCSRSALFKSYVRRRQIRSIQNLGQKTLIKQLNIINKSVNYVHILLNKVLKKMCSIFEIEYITIKILTLVNQRSND